MEKKEKYDVLKEIRKIRKKLYEETKHLTRAEFSEYFRKLSDRYEENMAKIDPNDGKYTVAGKAIGFAHE
ncbi:MAG: hypothetical protein LBK06_05580 [Planctomycetaceae bacterium]|jgi:hypothetical protein|nr:hypothetical protein [Planctomycetaceae bacterium]